jgi:hypothetical protein
MKAIFPFFLFIVCYNCCTCMCVWWYNVGTHANYVTTIICVETEIRVERQSIKFIFCYE